MGEEVITQEDRITAYCHTYVQLVSSGIAGDYARIEVHKKLLRATGLDEVVLKEVLHNLDKKVGLSLEPWEASESHLNKAGEKLAKLLLSLMNHKEVN